MMAALSNGRPALPPMVALSAHDTALIEAAARLCGVQHCLSKPVLPATLRQLLTSTLGEQQAARQAAPAGPDLQGMRVLLVEDHAVNRQLATELMAQRGVQVETAEHGQAALERLAAAPADYFHAVLMDLQMPVMDGYEATRRLRLERRYHALPVIAMTAHAMQQERERCTAAGMNGHLSKPVEPERLYALLAHYYGPVRAAASGLGLAPIAGVDMEGGLRRAGGRPELYRRLLASFVTDFGTAAASLRSQLAQGQWTVAERQSHTLRGFAATVGAGAVAELAADLERDCRARAADAAQASLMRLEAPLQALLEALA